MTQIDPIKRNNIMYLQTYEQVHFKHKMSNLD